MANAGPSSVRTAVDPRVAPLAPDATTASGEHVSITEIEAAGELSKLAGRLGLGPGQADGYRLFRAYRFLVDRQLARRVSRRGRRAL